MTHTLNSQGGAPAALALVTAALAAISLSRAEEPIRTGPQTESRFPPLVVPPGFKATLFACDPLIEYPSVIAAGPRPGAIFVAIDYMTGLGTDIVRRSEVRLVQDTDGNGYADEAKVFAGGFNSIQGIAWHDSTLFVMHAPLLTALRDTQAIGAANERTDLLSGLGLTPEENPVRLHCANGVAIGHDGWLYLALGDHGCDVKRPEGDRLVLQGGGILRCRPSGRDLHVFSTGLRNIYDVALDEELNVFVRDNENDGGTYKIRVCHSFHGADHGYPYLYENRSNEAMPPLADLGLGSSAGGAVYLEPQFPAEYRGNLLFCEWGKSVVRYPLASTGSSFAQPAEIEFASAARDDPYGFKPTDVVVQRDGSLMVSDYADGQRPKRGRGRIYKIEYVGDNAPINGRANVAAIDSAPQKWLAQLNAESYFARCEAQAAIERLGRDGLMLVEGALSSQQLGVRGRLHAVWIMARISGPTAIEELLKLAESDRDTRVRAQAVRAIADLADPVLVHHRVGATSADLELAQRLAILAGGQDASVLREIVIALGRMRWAGTADWITPNLQSPDPALAHAAMQALRRSENWPAILRLLDSPTADSHRAIALVALAERYEPQAVQGLIERLSIEKTASRQREYAELLARVHKKPGPWTYWGYRPPPRPPNSQTWEWTEPIERALDGALAGSNVDVRLAVLRSMQREKIPASLPTLARWLEDEGDPDRMAAILVSLRDQPAADVRPHLSAIILGRHHSDANRLGALAHFGETLDEPSADALLSISRDLDDGPVLAVALRRLAKYPSSSAGTLLTGKLNSKAPEVRAAATFVLAERKAEELRQPLLALLGDADARVRQAAADAAGKLEAKESVAALLKLASDGDPAVRRSSFDSLRVLNEKRAVPLALAALNDRHVSLKAIDCLAALGGPQHAPAVTALARQDPSAEIVLAAIRALTQWSDDGASTAERTDLDRAVAEIHAACGTIIRWRIGGPLPAQSASTLVAQLEAAESGEIPDRQTLFATGTEGHVTLAPKSSAEQGVWVAQSMVHVAEPTAVEFLASAGGTLQVWLNGKSIHRRDEARGFRFDSDRFAATLAQGNNRLTVMVGNSKDRAEFHLRFRRKSAAAEHERLTQAALARAGNPDRGRQLFHNVDRSNCLKCHRVGDAGERTGPELSGVGSRFSRIYLVESILEPSRTIAPSFGSTNVLLDSGQSLLGVKVAETESQITLADNQGQKHVVVKAQIEQQKPSSLSTMPDGLEKRLTEQEFVDLVAFLSSLKESRGP